MSENVVSITAAPRWKAPRWEPPQIHSEPEAKAAPIGIISANEALLTAILSALSVGNQRDRSLFGLVRYELDRMLQTRPESPGTLSAMAVLRDIHEANHGR